MGPDIKIYFKPFKINFQITPATFLRTATHYPTTTYPNSLLPICGKEFEEVADCQQFPLRSDKM